MQVNPEPQTNLDVRPVSSKVAEDLELNSKFKKNSIKILSYNMFLRPLVKNNESDYKYERLEEFTTSHMNEFDIICNQEVFEGFNSFKATLTSKASEAGFIDFAYSKRPKLFDKYVTDSGLIILSRYPIVESDSIVYEYNVGDCSASSKGSVYAKVDVNGQFIHVFNTHMQASYYFSFDTYKRWINYRMYQSKQLARFIDSKTKNMGAKDIIVVWGDFNISSRKFGTVHMNKLKELSVRDQGFEVFLDPDVDTLKEYKSMMKLLTLENTFKVTDFKQYLADDKGNPTTFGGVDIDEDGTIFPVETALTNKHDLMLEQSIDYIFQFERNQGYKSADVKTEETKNVPDSIPKEIDPSKQGVSQNEVNGSRDLLYESQKFKVAEDSIKVEKFPVSGQKFTTLSDHFGVSVKINIS